MTQRVSTTQKVLSYMANIPTQQRTIPGGLFFALLGLGCLCVGWGSLLTNVTLLPAGLASLHLANSMTNYSLIISLGAIATVVMHPLTGAFLDHTQKRRLCLLASLLLFCIGYLLIAHASSLFLLAVGCILAQLATGGILFATLATMLLRIPLTQRALSAAIIGAGPLIGGVLGQGLYYQVMHANMSAAISVLLGMTCLILLPFSFLSESFLLALPPSPVLLRTGQSISGNIAHAFRHGDFTWTWIARGLMFLAYTTTVNYSTLLLGSQQQLFFGLSVLALVVTAFVIGKWSDRLQRRKRFVIGASMVLGSGLILLGFAQTTSSILVAAVIFGVGFGAYQSTDLALASQVLPLRAEEGRDLGLMNAAIFLPMLIGPVLAVSITDLFHSYRALCLVLALGAWAAAFCVAKIRQVK